MKDGFDYFCWLDENPLYKYLRFFLILKRKVGY